MNPKLIVCNWKMNPASAEEAKRLGLKLKDLTKNKKHLKLVLAPPAPFISLVTPARKVKNFTTCSQDLSFLPRGAHTGHIAPEMFKTLGVEYALVGHSEQRAEGDTDEIVARKTESAIRAGLKTIICVGETRRDKEGKYLNLLKKQVVVATSLLKKSYLKDVLIAYEPVWAIGGDSSGADTPESFFHNALFIKKVFAGLAGSDMARHLPVLYGGSVGTDNAEGFLTDGRAGGLLIGRASLMPDQMKDIINMAERVGNKK